MERSEKKALIAALSDSPHGDLKVYVPTMTRAIAEDADFYGHMVAWNHRHGQVRDAKVALPVGALLSRDPVLVENGLAHLASLSPRLLVQALDFAAEMRKGYPAVPASRGSVALAAKPREARAAIPPAVFPQRTLKRLVERYLRDLEADPRAWERTTIRHRANVKTLYARYHVKPSRQADAALFKGTGGGAFAVVRTLANLAAEEAAGMILRLKLPFLTARGAVGAKAKDTSVAVALIKAASPTELVTNAKAFDRLGIKTVPALRAAFEEALAKAGSKSKRPAAATLKTTRAAEVLEDDVKLSAKLRDLQERQLDNLAGIDGDWLVIGDKSSSMSTAIEATRLCAAALARMVKGHVYVVFADSSPRFVDATGKTYEELKKITSTIQAGGNTSLGCGLRYIVDKKLSVDGIAVISDGGENTTPWFAEEYLRYQKQGHETTVYFYQLAGDPDVLSGNCKRAGIDLQTFDLRKTKVDLYSLPNLVQTMKVGRYQLIDDVLSTPLLTLDDVLDKTVGMPVLPRPAAATV